MAKTSAKATLENAKKNKNNEFYTQLSDVESELRHYESHFEGKIVYCNCDDPRISNFFHYFSHKFESLKLKKLISACHKSENRDMFSQNDSEKAIYLEYNGVKSGNRVPAPDEIGTKHFIKSDGDFRTAECIALLEQADIVVTNPPFSLFREYIAQLVEYNKKFVILGSKNAITYKDVFALIKENKVWIGNKPMGTDMLFDVSKDFAQELVTNKKEGSAYKVIDDIIKGRAAAIWYTNLDIAKRHEDLILYKTYEPENYPEYDNYDAINVDKVKDIPKDYTGAMGVPVSFMDKYNPAQFEIIALGITGSIDFTTNKKMKILDKNGLPTGKSTWNAKGTLYRRYNPKSDKSPVFKDVETGELYSSIYARIIIKNRRV